MIRSSVLLMLLAATCVCAQPTAASRDRAVKEAAKGIVTYLQLEKPEQSKQLLILRGAPKDTVCSVPLTQIPIDKREKFAKRIVPPKGSTATMPAIVVPAPPCQVI